MDRNKLREEINPDKRYALAKDLKTAQEQRSVYQPVARIGCSPGSGQFHRHGLAEKICGQSSPGIERAAGRRAARWGQIERSPPLAPADHAGLSTVVGALGNQIGAGYRQRNESVGGRSFSGAPSGICRSERPLRRSFPCSTNGSSAPSRRKCLRRVVFAADARLIWRIFPRSKNAT